MSFPLTVGGEAVASLEALAALVVRACRGGGPGRPSAWLPALVREGRLDAAQAMALTAQMLLQPEAALVAEGARLVRALHPSELSALVMGARAHHDPTLLLQVDPGAEGVRSVEDTLLEVACDVADLTDPAVRRALLEALRHAGLPALEGAVLLGHGTLDELREGWPALTAEGWPEGLGAAVRARLARGDTGAAWLAAQAGVRTMGR